MMFTILFCATVPSAVVRREQAGLFPEGPSQQCRDDAGPPWSDDVAGQPYYGPPMRNRAVDPNNLPVLDDRCPPPLEGACEAKGALAAHMEGPVDCGGRGWFCRITEEADHRQPGIQPGSFPDSNFVHCNHSSSDEPWQDTDGHCHGSDVDNVYPWWIRDHWHRNYAGRLKCCCDLAATTGIVNRCDYRKYVAPGDLATCRDANEEHSVKIEPGCPRASAVIEPPAEQCWEVEHFGPGEVDPDSDGDSGHNDGDGDGDDGDGYEDDYEDDDDRELYVLSDRGRCIEGYSPILSKEQCEDAAAELGKADTRASTTPRSDRPLGCYYRPASRKKRRLWFAPEGNPSSPSRTRFGICIRDD